MRWRTFLVVAILTVLWGAPSTVFAAGNALSSPEATPTTGTTLTLFALSVSYSGSPAIAVTVSVAGRTIPMDLTRGSTTQGSWSATATLPEGSWPTTFHAETSQGRDPSVKGPNISVSGLAGPTLPAATVVPVGPATPDEPVEPEGPTSSSTEAPAAPAVPDDSPAGESPSSTPQAPSPRGGSETAPAAPVSSDGAAGGAAPSQPGGTGSAQAQPSSQPGAGPADLASPQDDAPEAARASSANRVPSGNDDQAAGSNLDHQGPGVLPIAAGIGGLAAAALLGWLALLAGRRRRATADAAAGPREPPARDTGGDAVDAALLRRTLRRARMRIEEEDPILTSVGIGLPSSENEAIHRARRPRRQPPT